MFPIQFGIPVGVELFLFLLLSLLPLVLAVVVSVLIYRDALDRNSDHALAWGLASLLGSLVVWVLYAVVRDEVGP